MTNHGGCAILNEMITYPDRKETRKKFQKTGMPWWSNEKANLLLVPIFSAMDGTVLYSIMEECFLQSALMSIVMAFGVAVVLNILPLVIAKFLHGAIYKTTKHGLTMFAVFVAGFLLVYGGTVYLRFAYSDMYEQENQSMTLENTVSEEKVENGTENVQEISEKRRKSMAVVTLLSISPLITSLLGFAIAYVSDDEIRRKVECLELEKIEIDEKISEIDAAIAQMEHYMEEGIERELTFDEQARMQLMRDFGCYPAAHSAFLLNLGLETLPVRMKQYCENAMAVAKMLKQSDKIASVTYPNLPDDPYHEMAKKYLPNGTCGVISISIKGGREAAVRFMDALQLASIEVHVADIRTCVLHPASATHRQLTEEQLKAAGIDGGLIRISVGLENIEDILADLQQALERV